MRLSVVFAPRLNTDHLGASRKRRPFSMPLSFGPPRRIGRSAETIGLPYVSLHVGQSRHMRHVLPRIVCFRNSMRRFSENRQMLLTSQALASASLVGVPST